MPKFYVESGDLKVVVQATGPIPAVAKALAWATPEDRLDPHVVVNERGFVSDRRGRRRYKSDIVLETGTMMGLIKEHELA